ncbi:hypothetical protein [Lacunimicrobium album]
MSLATASAEEILVKLQTVVEGQTLNGKPIELACSEILASTEEPFRVKLMNGDTTLTLKGQLKSLADREYSLNCEEIRVVEKEGEEQKRVATTVDSQLKLDSPVLLGYTRGPSRWLGKRGRVHNSSMYIARARVEVVLKTPDAIQE